MPRFFMAGTNILGGMAIMKGRDAEHVRVLRGITFIRSSRKSGLQMIYQNMNRPLSEKSQTHQKTVVRCNPKLHQQNRPLFVM